MAIPPWNDDEALHESHRSKLVQKAPEHYRGLFPAAPDDLDYVWPGTPDTQRAPTARVTPPASTAHHRGA
ncbi:hypothetical protein [Curtobacterium sp. VKM Ac-1393]|uniref:hypothetical protein n=1 Tax=Curtobacterium sp. VKM Ac-1393 TaxID=2783814 RepID=UPI001E647BD4|nr:hypothetical protein [Curtobacterium sp. VKM Ac-1393]